MKREVLIPMNMKTAVFWYVMTCNLSSRGTCCLHLQDRNIFALIVGVTGFSALMVTEKRTRQNHILEDSTLSIMIAF
jgi:hypothetical protein